MIQSDELKHPNLRHGFFTRRGGVSSGVFSSLNCGYKNDDPAHIAENRRRALDQLGLEAYNLRVLSQIHSAKVVTLTDAAPLAAETQGDALVTTTPGLALGVVTADCTPVLLADPVNGVIGAIHSGWKGTAENISEATVAAMEALGAKRQHIMATVGPCIAQTSYEVGPELHEIFVSKRADYARFFIPSPKAEHYLFDLPGCVVSQLSAAGVQQVRWTGHDTCALEDEFFSNRRTFHQGGGKFGLQLSTIALA